MTTSESFVIIGGGLAGAKAAQALRDQGFTGSITLLGGEPHRPYERPPLSKGFLTGGSGRDDVYVHTADWYAENNVDLRVNTAAVSIDRQAHRVQLGDGTSIAYDRLLLATGASPRSLPITGADARGVLQLRTLDDADVLSKTLAGASRVAIIGAGWIGLEIAAAARQSDVGVTVIESAQLPLLRVLGPEVATVFADLHRAHDVDLRLGASVDRIVTQESRATGVALSDGTIISGDAVLVAVGAVPNTQLAVAAGLDVDNGVLVDAGLRTSDPDIFAVGDVANAFHPGLDRHLRVEHWDNAVKQPVTAATSMLGGDAMYTELPYFYTDQYDLGMEYVGNVGPGGYDQVVFRGDVDQRRFIAFWLAQNRVLAAMNVNVWDVADPIRDLIRSGATVDPAKLADPAHPMRSATTG